MELILGKYGVLHTIKTHTHILFTHTKSVLCSESFKSSKTWQKYDAILINDGSFLQMFYCNFPWLYRAIQNFHVLSFIQKSNYIQDCGHLHITRRSASRKKMYHQCIILSIPLWFVCMTVKLRTLINAAWLTCTQSFVEVNGKMGLEWLT